MRIPLKWMMCGTEKKKSSKSSWDADVQHGKAHGGPDSWFPHASPLGQLMPNHALAR